MIEEKMTQARTMGTHFQYAALQVAKRMTSDELVAFAAEVGGQSFIGLASRMSTGIHNRTGKQLSADEISEQRSLLISKVADHMMGLDLARRAAAERNA